MKKTIKALKLTIAFLLTVSSFIACDKDFSVVESDVLGKDNANFKTGLVTIPISAYNKKISALQINNLASNLLGVFNDPAYGQTTASIITQIRPSSYDPDFGDNPEIDSVVLSIPYFNRVVGLDENGYKEYFLDSLYGGGDSLKLSIYENKYFLRAFNPDNLDENQNYYSNASTGTENLAFNDNSLINFDDHKGDLILEIPSFIPNKLAVKTTIRTDSDTITTRSVPALREKMSTSFWTSAILDKEGDVVLSNPSNFNNYFRGLYFKAEATNNAGSMILINLASTSANIIIYYSKDATTEGERIQSTYTLTFSGYKLNTFINDYNLVTIPDANSTLGDEKLYLKGAAGSMAVVDLFTGLVDCDGDGNVDDDALECFKKTYRATDNNGDPIIEAATGDFVLKKLINDAQLIVYEDTSIPTPDSDEDFHKYDRIYAYDINNNIPTVDYLIDPIENATEPFNSKLISLTQRDTEHKKYKIRLTEHLNNILKKDSSNTKIGLVLSTNVNYTTNAKLLNSTDGVTAIPAASILTPRGTILHGNNVKNADEAKRMTLKVFFTEIK